MRGGFHVQNGKPTSTRDMTFHELSGSSCHSFCCQLQPLILLHSALEQGLAAAECVTGLAATATVAVAGSASYNISCLGVPGQLYHLEHSGSELRQPRYDMHRLRMQALHTLGGREIDLG